MKLQLEKRAVTDNYRHLPWATCLPFVENSRGVLIHRPRYVSTFNVHKLPHIAIQYWCGCGASGGKKFTFHAAPPEGKLLCERCEQQAVLRGMPSADSLAMKHVHLGKLVAVQTCCAAAEIGKKE